MSSAGVIEMEVAKSRRAKVSESSDHYYHIIHYLAQPLHTSQTVYTDLNIT